MQYILYNTFGKSRFFNELIRQIYFKVLIPLFVKISKFLFSNIRDIKIRNSITSKENFNAILSDIDLLVVVSNGAQTKKLLKFFVLMKKYLKIFDYPEVYEESEYIKMVEIKNSKNWNFIEKLWLIRKINWNLKSMTMDKSELNRVKKKRSNSLAIEKIINNPSGRYSFKMFDSEHFPCLILSIDNETVQLQDYICYYSNFLETSRVGSLSLLVPNYFFFS